MSRAPGSQDLPYSATPGGVRLAVRLTPRAARDGLDGVVRAADGRPALQLRVKAPPVEGAANAALIAWLAKALGLRKADVAIDSGAASRSKLVTLSGDAEVLAERLNALIATGGR
jgi:uncharacterized protein (TIGR00251 family)